MLASLGLWSAALLQASSGAAPAPPQAPTPRSTDQRVAESANLGRLLYTFDQAASVSSDALTAVAAQDIPTGLGGYVVEALDDEILRVTYYRGAAATAQAFFVADVRRGKVVRKDRLVQPVPLSADQAILARARDAAAARARDRGYTPCTPKPFNTVVLPSRKGGPVAAYLLSAQVTQGTFPMGGNYRVIVAPDGTVLASRPYSVSCLPMTAPKLPKGATPVGFMVAHLLDPVPTEIHVFASYRMRMPVFVSTPDGQVWRVEGSIITAVAKEAAPPAD